MEAHGVAQPVVVEAPPFRQQDDRFSGFLIIAFCASIAAMGLFCAAVYLLIENALPMVVALGVLTVFAAICGTLVALFTRDYVIQSSRDHYRKHSEQLCRQTHTRTARAAQHVVNNVLNSLQIIRIDMENDGYVSPSSLELLDKSIADAEHRIYLLGHIREPGRAASYEDIYP